MGYDPKAASSSLAIPTKFYVMKTIVRKQFLINSEETGRFIVKSIRTGKVYFVEPIHEGKRVQWGDIDPASKKVTGSYGKKYAGAVSPKESILTKENGFDHIEMVKGSPFAEIERRDRVCFNG